MNPEPNKIVVPTVLRASFAAAWARCRVVYVCGPCGVGKTALAHALLQGQRVCAYSAFAPELRPESPCPDCDTVLIDDFQALEAPTEQQTLCRWINEDRNGHFVFLSRGVLPGWLMPYQFTGLLTTIDMQAMLLDPEAVRELLTAAGAAASDADAEAILRDTGGYPLLVARVCSHMAGGRAYSRALLDECRRELFHYLEDAVYHRFSPSLRSLLVALSSFDQFDAELAKIISGDSHVSETLGDLLRKTTMLRETCENVYRFLPIFRDFLQWEMQRDCTPEQQNSIYRRAGLYYELQNDLKRALDCYTQSGDHNKLSELLEKSAAQQIDATHYYDMEQYYHALPEADVLRSPALMAGMSMLTAICADYDASDRWYAQLQNYTARLKQTDANYAVARAKLAYLDIALPQRGSRDLEELLTAAFRMSMDTGFQMPALSATCALPSLMNGGKDLCLWSKNDELLYETLRLPMETVLGRNGVGAADIGICESKYEKGEDVSSRALALMSCLNDIRCKGSPDTLFACIGLLARIQLAGGSPGAAMEALDNLRESFVAAGETRFLPNLDAMRCRIWLYTGEMEQATKWLNENAPSGVPRFRFLWLYQYLTKALVQIAVGAPYDALMTLAPMLPYCQRCERTMDGLYLHLLGAICQYRRKDSAWKAELETALDTAWEYRFITPVAQWGAAILPLLNECGWSKDRGFFEKLLSAARTQTVHYPSFLRPAAAASESLTPAELQVLKLLCAHHSNQEICDILGVKMSTVKTQVWSIFQKLQIKRRGEAKDAAQRLHLI